MMAKLIQLTQSQTEQFCTLIDTSGGTDECWPWCGAQYANGYGDAGITGAHRIAYFLANKKQPRSKVVRHTCHNKLCCNPAHLKLGTQADNVQDAKDRGTFPSKTRKKRVRLTQEQRQAIVDASPKKAKELARQFGINRTYIYAIRKKRRDANSG